MAQKPKRRRPFALRPRLRIARGAEIALGPGKADLLDALRENGSITQAAAHLGMSYMRAWTLIRTMNRCFREPLVIAIRGGTKGGGGARLTKSGREVLALYHRINRKCLANIKPDWQKLQVFLRD